MTVSEKRYNEMLEVLNERADEERKRIEEMKRRNAQIRLNGMAEHFGLPVEYLEKLGIGFLDNVLLFELPYSVIQSILIRCYYDKLSIEESRDYIMSRIKRLKKVADSYDTKQYGTNRIKDIVRREIDKE